MEEQEIKKGFFRRIWYSLTKIEKYPNMAAEGLGKSLTYLTGLLLLCSIVFSIAIMFKINNFDELLVQSGLQETQQQEIMEYINSTEKVPLYATIFGISLMSSYLVFFGATLIFIIILSIFGYFAAILAKIKMKYVAIFNMTVYSITLSLLLEVIYTITNMYTEFTSNYFTIAYIAIACIYLISSIFIIKSEFIKKQEELKKIREAQEHLKEERKNEKKDEEGE